MLAGVVLAIALSFAQSPAKAEWLCGVNKCVWVTYDVDEPDFDLAVGTADSSELLLEAGPARPLEVRLLDRTAPS